MSKLAIIPARGGSKRIPRKNIKLFHGKPIIAYSIEVALQSGLFDEVMVSTDDNEIAEISKQYGATIPFYRSAKTSDDFATTSNVIIEVIQQLKDTNQQYEFACCLYPTAPFITKPSLTEGYNLLNNNNYTSVFPVCRFGYPIQRSLRIKEAQKVEMMFPENLEIRSQDLPAAYHDAGQFYWIKVDSFLKDRTLFTKNSGAIIIDEMQAQDIDNETDWKLAEMKYKLLNEKP